MKIISAMLLLIVVAFIGAACTKQVKEHNEESMEMTVLEIEERFEAFSPVLIDPDISHLSEGEQQLIAKLVEAGKLADELFWIQTAPDAIAVRDSLMSAEGNDAKIQLKFVNLMYGPYDRVYEGERFVANGPAKKPPVANYYPQDMTKEEFETYVENHPDQKAALEGQYTVVKRNDDGLIAVPFHVEYPTVQRIAALLTEASELAENASLKKYLALRAEAIRSDDYFESDMAWMELKDNNVDVVIGPIENYEDQLFNYKTAYECAVMVKDLEGTAELQKYIEHIDAFEKALPQSKEYIRESAGKGNVLEVVNIVYFGGDFQAGIKTIAASLPNDPRVHEAKGGKKQMYKNLMEAKFEKIVVPIAEEILDPALLSFVDKKAFTNFVTLHEVSHTLGRSYVYGKDDLTVRKALEERYSTIEECKADVLGAYNLKHLLKVGLVDDYYIKQSMATYLAGLYRSLRFGAEEAHGRANLLQLNWLRENGAIDFKDGKLYIPDEDKFMATLKELARELLTLQSEGDYERAGVLLDSYGVMNDEINGIVERLSSIPRDLNTSYRY
jgi:peptidase M49-like protein